MTPAMQQLLNTPKPEGFDTKALYLRRWLLDLQLEVNAAQAARHRQLRDALHLHVAETMQEAIDSLIEVAADELYEKLTKAEPE